MDRPAAGRRQDGDGVTRLGAARARRPAAGGAVLIASRTGVADGVKLHYLTAGSGPVIVLLHGYAETSRMWRPLIPTLAPRFRVIAPDLPGIGDSDVPRDGLDMARSATRIHALVKGLGIEKAVVVGHDIGLMVAYAYAAQFRSETEKLVLMDAFLPGVAGWEAIYNDPAIWHFRFNEPQQRRWSKDASGSTSSTSGTTSPLTRRSRSRRPGVGPTRRRTRVPAECGQPGPISSRFRRRRKTSRGCRRPGSTCRFCRSAATWPTATRSPNR